MGAAILEEVLCPYETVGLGELSVEPAGGSAFGRQARFEKETWYEACRHHKVSRNNGRCEPFSRFIPTMAFARLKYKTCHILGSR